MDKLFLVRLSAFLLCVAILVITKREPKHFVIVTASYNNKNYYDKNLSSIFSQKYDNWRLIYINDNSTDGTDELVEKFVKKWKQEHRVTLIHNKKRKGHLHNQYHAIHSCNNDEIIVIVDGDDWLANNNVLGYLNDFYQKNDIWLTYGRFKYLKSGIIGSYKLPNSVIETNSIRTYSHYHWLTSHLRTFYAGLFKLIHLKDLKDANCFFPMCADVATMIPMIEMAGEHAHFVPYVLYIYNNENPLSFFHSRRHLQEKYEKKIRSKKPYERLQDATFLS